MNNESYIQNETSESDALRLGTKHVNFKIFLRWFWPVSLDKNSYKPAVLKAGWLITRITRDLKKIWIPGLYPTLSWSESLEIRQPKYVLEKAPHVILIISQILEGLLHITSQISLDIGPRDQPNRSTSGQESAFEQASKAIPLWVLWIVNCVNTIERWISGFILETSFDIFVPLDHSCMYIL